MTTDPPSVRNLATTIGEPTRLLILAELLGGVALPAGALATRVGLVPSTVTAHLTRPRQARSCYDHLAGRAGVLLADRALAHGWVVEVDGAWLLGPGQPRS